MRILIFTQKVDRNDSVLGFFHTWITELSKKFSSVEVICLQKGEFDLPKNVTVYSLGKEREISKIGYIINLYKYLRLISGSYDSVFVHMNQEYVLLAGLYWKLKGIPVYLWRNHPKGSILTRIAILLSTKVFCTSSASFTARFKKTVVMPAGIDTNNFKSIAGVVRKKYSVCVIGRISPVKHVDLALQALHQLVLSGSQVSFTIVGPVLEKDKKYFQSLNTYLSNNKLSSYVQFLDPVSQDKLPEIYSSHEICLNLTDTGSFDKTIVESASCGLIPLVSNASLSDLLPPACITGTSPVEIAESIKRLLNPHEQIKIQNELQKFVLSQSLSSLMDKLSIEINNV